MTMTHTIGTTDHRPLTTDSRRRRYRDVRELIASPENPTPLVRLNRVLPAGRDAHLKLEWFNPFGSIKDRTARALLEGMRQRDELRDRELVEAILFCKIDSFFEFL